ncbi:tyrosine-type recombinase/integrase [Ruegeria jejuensis]|uniref:tyrosine-type recombinase/integrase n=1 Tax=Ruegeria jejuensis TaxID=3233338 RepID=UPI00355C4C0D
MPLEAYKRGKIWWVKGRIDYNGRPITSYYRCSTEASTEAGAEDWIKAEENRQIRRHLLGDEASLTFAEAVTLYDAKPAEAGYLIPITKLIGSEFVSAIKPGHVRDLARTIYPDCATDTWHRQVITPVSAVINNAHDKGKCAPIRIKSYTAQQRIDQDRKRGKQSREPRKAGSWDWIRAVQPGTNPYVAAGLEFMFETGLRISQLVAIEPRDCDLQNARVRIIASKGHPEQWISISMAMVVVLANLKPRRPHNRKLGYKLPMRVFGYADRSGFTAELRRACKRAGVEYLSPHQAGRHGFYTELRVRQGVDPVTAAKAGRWSNPALPDKIYAQVEGEDREMRDRIRTGSVQRVRPKPAKLMKQKG